MRGSLWVSQRYSRIRMFSGGGGLRNQLRGVLRSVDLFANKGEKVVRPLDAREPRIEHQVRHTSGGLNFDFKNSRLQRIKKPLVQEVDRHLIRNSTRGLHEHLVGDTGRLSRIHSHSNGRKDVEIVGLSRQER